ncbi:PLP-dependent transferase [Melanomma pulvis-pyrius CBS 109.77]|uniref:PLP-dependent transferase n=1 Tax=Melanomma pulvis-pyrius CBS 109.77 TaxID=1314802 RepID=A0A6A6XXS6_9PLEO|nr:PLP-dependent transferase [Melanomma pulvis-pyrius CBS 109.77]
MTRNVSTRIAGGLQGILPRLADASPPKGPSHDTIDLSSAENILIRDQLQDMCKAAIQNHLNSDTLSELPSFGGDVGARTALASFLNNYFRPASTVSADHIVLTAGAGLCIEALIHSICDEGDSVIIPGPHWFGFQPYITLRPKVNIITATPPTYARHGDDLVSTLRATYNDAETPERIKAMILCNPHNPFSQCYTEQGLRECMKFCQEFGLHLISDELYALATIKTTENQRSEFISTLSLMSNASDAETLIDPSLVHVVWSASKLLGLSGLRIGCVVSQSNPEIRAAVSLLTYLNVSSLSAITLTAILSSPDLSQLLYVNSQRITASYACFTKLFRGLNVEFLPAQEGLFIFAKLGKSIMSIEEEIAFFENLRQRGVLVSAGRFYSGLSTEFGWARVLIAVPLATAEEAVKRLSLCIS